ncbi:MAG: hypothetical protein PHC29_01510 [Candidatus Omnitrophica bacterium]|nr:hypothetical protein [Candidatus Omnitrophota bacterium]
MMENKRLVGKNILVTLISKILIVILIFSIVLIGELWICNKPIFAENQGVTITTDKTEYSQGDTVTIIGRNGLDKSIWGFNSCGGRPFWGLQKLTDGTWKNLDLCLPLKNKKDWECIMVLCERSEPRELKSKLEIKDEWHITFFCDFINEKGILLDKPKERIIKKGIYRLVLSYVFDEDSIDREIIYSNEFKIK